MAVTEVPTSGLEATASAPRREMSPLVRILLFTAKSLASTLAAVVIAVYITIWIANLGGHLDEIRKNEIRLNISMFIGQSDDFKHLTATQRREIAEQLALVEIQRLNLDKPFFNRSFSYLWNGLTLNLGQADHMTSDTGSKRVSLILLDRLAPTLLLQATAFLLLFFTAVFVGLALSRGYGSFFDRLVVALAPTSAAPGWFYGIFLILFFAAMLKWLPFGGMVAAPPPPNPWDYFLSLMRHLILPVSAIFISSIFVSIFSYRTFFLIYSSEDYVDLAKAKGLTDRAIERRYVLRPTLPTIITQFALAVIGLWQGATILEIVFNWPGIGQLIYQASNLPDTPVIVATTIVFAYLLAITVIVLDFIYALVDPRVQVGAEEPVS